METGGTLKEMEALVVARLPTSDGLTPSQISRIDPALISSAVKRALRAMLQDGRIVRIEGEHHTAHRADYRYLRAQP